MALAFILAHPLLLFIFSPSTLALLNIFGVTTLLLSVLIGASLWRKRLDLESLRFRLSSYESLITG